MFSGSSGYHIYGGNFYQVSGDVNFGVRTHQHLALPAPRLLEAAATEEPDDGAPLLRVVEEDMAGREFLRASRNSQLRTNRQHPYETTSRPRRLSDRPDSSLSPVMSSPTTIIGSPESRHPHYIPAVGSSPPFDFNDHSDGPSSSPQIPAGLRPATVIYANNVNHMHNCGHRSIGLDILHRAVSLEALHDSAESFPRPPKCHPDTRTQMLDNLFEWATTPDATFPIYWLRGPAGAGKTAIMQTLCERLQEAGRLGGSFFFKHGHDTRGTVQTLFVTLAYQLALHNETLKQMIFWRVERDPTIVGRNMMAQLRALIIEPCRSLVHQSPIPLLIDGLDECADEKTKQEILHLIGNAVAELPSTIRILIASRPEIYIRETFEDKLFWDVLHSVDIEQSFESIRKYLQDEFCRIHREHKATMANVPVPWPSNNIIEDFVRTSSGYFIYASTIVKFIDDKNFRPTERLSVVQNFAHSPDAPFNPLDQLYIEILSRVPTQFHQTLSEILCAIAEFGEFRNLRLENIDELLGLESGNVQLILRNLGSLVRMQESLDAFQFYHASFLDFLRDPARSSDFCITPHRMTLARAVLRAFSYEAPYVPCGVAETLRLSWPISMVWILPCDTELLPRLLAFDPDWLPWEDCKDNEMVAWYVLLELKKIQPMPQDLIQQWENYRLLNFFEHLKQKIFSRFISAWTWNTIAVDWHSVVYPSIKTSKQIRARIRPMTTASLVLLSECPVLLQLLHAKYLLQPDQGYLSIQPIQPSIAMVRELLNLSWTEISTAIGTLRSIVNKNVLDLGALLLELPQLCSEFHSIVSRDLACGFLRIFQSPFKHRRFWVAAKEVDEMCLQWGRYVRSSPHSDASLLGLIQEFVPPWNIMASVWRVVDFYDVLQWLKASPNPQIELIERWQEFFNLASDRTKAYTTDEELEKRWRVSIVREDEFHRSDLASWRIIEVADTWKLVPAIIQDEWDEYQNKTHRKKQH